MSLMVGLLIDIEKINNECSKICLDASNDQFYSLQIRNDKLKKIKIGEHIVVYKDKEKNELNIKLLNDII